VFTAGGRHKQEEWRRLVGDLWLEKLKLAALANGIASAVLKPARGEPKPRVHCNYDRAEREEPLYLQRR